MPFFNSLQKGTVVSGAGVRYHPTCWDLTDFLLGLVADNSIVILQSLLEFRVLSVTMIYCIIRVRVLKGHFGSSNYVRLKIWQTVML